MSRQHTVANGAASLLAVGILVGLSACGDGAAKPGGGQSPSTTSAVPQSGVAPRSEDVSQSVSLVVPEICDEVIRPEVVGTIIGRDTLASESNQPRSDGGLKCNLQTRGDLANDLSVQVLSKGSPGAERTLKYASQVGAEFAPIDGLGDRVTTFSAPSFPDDASIVVDVDGATIEVRYSASGVSASQAQQIASAVYDNVVK